MAGHQRGSAPPGRWIDRFIDIADWPTSRKTLLMTGVLLPVQLIGSAGAAAAFHLYPLWGLDAPLIDTRLNDAFLVLWLSGTVIAGLCAWIPARRGDDAPWTAYLFILPFTLGLCGLTYLFGTMSTPFIAVYPVAMFLLALYFEGRVGLRSFLFVTGVYLTLGALETQGLIPHAPILRIDTVAAQNQPAWFLIHLFIVTLALAFCTALGMAIVFARRVQQARLQRAHTELQRAERLLARGNRLIRRYVPAQVADRLLSGQFEDMERTRRVKLALFFSDIEGFTAMADRLDPEELTTLLNEYLTEMTAIATAHHGIIDQLVGDGIMIFFGAPDASSDRDHALRAVHMALAMQHRMQALRQQWFDRGIEQPIRVRIGINVGYASVGNFGSPGRMVYSAIGHQVNLTARIQGACAPDGILISHAAWALVRDAVDCEPRGEITVKGVHHPVRVHAVTLP
jgi:class 3 adenylate cyclase